MTAAVHHPRRPRNPYPKSVGNGWLLFRHGDRFALHSLWLDGQRVPGFESEAAAREYAGKHPQGRKPCQSD